MPIVGQFASLARAGSFLLPGGAFESIATVTVGSGGAASMEFTNIGAGWQHLQLRFIARITRSGQARDGVALTVNGSGGTNYAIHELYGDGGSATAYGVANQAYSTVYDFPASTATASIFGAAVIDLLDYASTSKNKTFRIFGGSDRNGAGIVGLNSGLWNSTSAITSVKVAPLNGTDFVQHSTAALYGLRAP